jgi:hypothetical protein
LNKKIQNFEKGNSKAMFRIFLSCKSRDYGSDDKIINAFSLPDNYDDRRAGELNEVNILKSGE